MTQLCASGGLTVFIIQAFNGLGRHQETIPPEESLVYNHAGFWQSVFSASAGMALLKISIALNLLRLSSSPWYRISLWASIGILDINLGSAFLYFGARCLIISLRSFCLGIQLYGSNDLLLTLFPHGQTLGYLPRRNLLSDYAVCHLCSY
jgi:hypothetical protein